MQRVVDPIKENGENDAYKNRKCCFIKDFNNCATIKSQNLLPVNRIDPTKTISEYDLTKKSVQAEYCQYRAASRYRYCS